MANDNHFPYLIIGAGIGGLCAALALLKKGHSVTVLEQAHEISEIGAGLQISPNATLVLDALGVGDQLRKQAFAPNGIASHHWRTGQLLTRINFASLQLPSSYLHIHRADLQKLLLDAVQNQPNAQVLTNHKVVHIESNDLQATVTLENGDRFSANWLIGADGIHSVARSFVAGIHNPPEFTGNTAWRGLLKVDDVDPSLLPPPCANIWMGPGGHVVMYYLRDRSLLNFVAVTESTDWRDESWTQSAPLGEMLKDFNSWNPDLFNLLAHSEPKDCYRWALFDRPALHNWQRGRVLLLGDAAHPMLPFVAQGAAQAIEDAWVLATCLNRFSSDQAGQQYTAARADRTNRIQALSRSNMSLFHIRNPIIRGCRDLYAALTGRFLPQLAAKRVNWIYQENVTLDEPS